MSNPPESDERSLSPAPASGALRRFLRQVGPAGPFTLIVTALPAVGAVVVLSLAPKFIVPWLGSHGALGVGVYMIAFAVLGGFALAPTYANSVIGGWTFKFSLGLPAVMVGLAGAAMISFRLAHTIVGHRVEDVIHQHPRWEVVRDALVGGSSLKTTGMIVLLRLSPFLPFETTNALLAMCGVRPIPFLVGTLIGVLPRTAATVLAASQARRLDLHTALGRWMLVIGLLLALLCLGLIAWIARHALNRATGQK